jgi:opacity protein-like surface antigen
MKKILALLTIVVLFIGFANAQSKMYLGAGLEVAIPMGTFGDAAGTGFGGTATFEMSLMPQLNGYAKIGYLMWAGKEVKSSSYTYTTDYTAIPVLVGAKYFFAPSFYGLAELGIHSFSFEGESTYKNPITGATTTSSSSVSESKFGFGIGAGYEMPVGTKAMLDISVKYQNLPNELSYLGARVGVKFGI